MGIYLRKEGRRSLTQGPPRNGTTNPLIALCIVYINHNACQRVPSRDTIPGDLLSVDLLFNFYAEYIMQNAGLDEAQTGIKLLGEISTTS